MSALAPGQFDRLVKFDGPGVGPRQGPARKRQVVANIMAVHDQGTPEEHQAGSLWYPKVHDATEKGVRQHGLDSTLHGAGIVAAVSPQMDWDNNNIHAFSELAGLKSHQWDAISRSSQGEKRNPEAAGILHGMSISRAPDSGLLKAKRIMDGEHPDTVLNPRTAPKTNSFAHNIADPSRKMSPHDSAKPLATIDGRAHDIGVNRYLPWEAARGISSMSAKPSGTTRYEHFASAYHSAANIAGAESGHDMAPSEMQARTWVIGKRMERTAPGARSNRGPNRLGQAYV